MEQSRLRTWFRARAWRLTCALCWTVEKARPNRPVGLIERETAKKATGAAAQKAQRGLTRELARAYEI